MKIERIDHFVLTVRDIAATCDFYGRGLGMTVETFGAGRTALHFGRQKINLHEAGREFDPKAVSPMPGSGDFCLITETPLDEVVAHLQAEGLEIELMPSSRTGCRRPDRLDLPARSRRQPGRDFHLPDSPQD